MIRTTLAAVIVLSTSLANAAPPPKGDAALDAIWAGEPLSVAPEVMRKAAPVAPDNVDGDVLLRSELNTYSADHRVMKRHHMVVRVVTLAGIERYGTLRFPWSPWHEARPVVRARVITADGRVLELDPKTMSEATPQGDPLLVQDSKELIAPLPGVGRGAIIEFVSEVQETTKMYPVPGVTDRNYFAGVTPSRRDRLVIVAPASMVIAHHEQGVTVSETTKGDTRRLEVVTTPLVIDDSVDPRNLPMMTWSTGGSWQAMATAYQAIVERARADKVPAGTLTAKGTRAQKIDKILSDMRARVRYTGLELGESAIVPYSPAEVWRREYGDCKDMAVLLVAALADANVSARVALLQSGVSHDIDPALPGLDLFDHAIVYVPAEGAEPALWIDPTATGYGAGSLPPADIERWALVIDPATTAPIRTTGRADTRYGYRSEIDVKLDPFGANTLARRMVYSGAAAPLMRQGVEGVDEKGLIARYETWRASDLGGKIDHARIADKGTSVELALDASGADKLGSGWAEIVVMMTGYDMLEFFPELPATDRPLRAPMAYDIESRERFTAPVGFIATSGLGDQSEQLGPVLWKQTTAKLDGQENVVEVSVSFTVPAEWSAEDVAAFRKAYPVFVKKPRHQIVFHHAASALIDAGSVDAGLSRFRDDLAKSPTDGETRARLAIVLSDLGLNDVARAEVDRAVKDQPQKKSVLWVAAVVHSADQLGRLMMRGWDRPGTIALLRKLVKLDPTWSDARQKLASALLMSAQGGFEPLGPEVEEGLGLYRQLAVDEGVEATQLPYATTLWRLRRYAALADEGAKLGAKGRGPWLAAVVQQRGAAQALELATREVPLNEQQPALELAFGLVLLNREYPKAIELSKAIALRFPGARSAQSNAFEGLARRPTDLDRKTPEGAYLALVADIGADATPGGLLRTLKKATVPAHWRGDMSTGLTALFARAAKLDGNDSPGYELGQDLVWHLGKRTVDAAGTSGWRLRLDPGVGSKATTITSYWIPDKDGARLVALGENYPELGERARILAAAGDLAAAKIWLDWAREAARDMSDKLEGLGVWPPSGEPTRETIVAAAVWYASQSLKPHPDALNAALVALPSWSPSARGPIVSTLVTADPKVVLPVLDALTPRDEALDRARAGLMMRAGKLADARSLAESKLAADPAAREWALVLSAVAMYEGDVAAAAKRLEPLVAQGYDAAANNYAWYQLFVERASEETEHIAQRAVDHATKIGGDLFAHASLNTLTMIQLERGRWPEGVATLRRTIVDATDIDPDDWLLIGRLAEGLGYRDVAKKAYQRVPKSDEASSSWHLAQRRLKKISR